MPPLTENQIMDPKKELTDFDVAQFEDRMCAAIEDGDDELAQNVLHEAFAHQTDEEIATTINTWRCGVAILEELLVSRMLNSKRVLH